MNRAPLITVDLNSAEAVFRQISSQIRRQICDGDLAPGDELPGVRRLSMDLGVHFNTVAEAYRQLASEGWLDVSHGRAARVCERGKPIAAPETVSKMRGRLQALLSDMRAEGLATHRIRRELELALRDLSE